MIRREEDLIKAISKVTGIREEKIERYSQNNEVLNLLKRPKTIDPTKLQMEKINLLNEFLVNYSITKEFSHKKEISFTDSNDVGEYFKHLLGNKKDKEVFMCAFLDRNNQLIKIKKISEGTLSAAVVFPRVIDHVIVGDDITSFKNIGLINHSKDIQFNENAGKEDYSIGKEYYKDHEVAFIESLFSLANIDFKKIHNYFNSSQEGENENQASDILGLIENPILVKDILNLNNREMEKLISIKDFLQNYNALSSRFKTEDKISGPLPMVELFKDKISDDGKEDIYLMLFNTKLVLIGIEKLTNRNDGNITLSPRDILSKTLAYEAASISLIHVNSLQSHNATNLAKEIAQNTFNMTVPLQLRMLDYLFIDDKNYISFKEKGLMPYTVVGSAEYNKVNIGIDNEYHQEMEDEEYEIEF